MNLRIVMGIGSHCRILRPRGTDDELDRTDRDSSSGDGVSTMSGGFNRLGGRVGDGALGWREEGNGGRGPPSTEDSNWEEIWFVCQYYHDFYSIKMLRLPKYKYLLIPIKDTF